MVQKRIYLDAMGIRSWVRRDVPPAEDVVPERRPAPPAVGAGQAPPPQAAGPEARADLSALDWDALAARVAQCTACDLHAARTQAVFGVGDRNAEWLIVGEAPGAEEDRRGEPFVGRAGQLLNQMLRAIGLRREQVYITNVVKCRPPDNRNPHASEIAQCEGYLRRQVELVAPRLILAVGRIAAHSLLRVDTPLGRLRGQVHRYGDTPLVVTYHPAYLLRTPRDKAKAWADLRFARAQLRADEGPSG